MNFFKSILILIFSVCQFGMSAQQLHMPDQIEQYMKKSPIQYNIDSLLTIMDSIPLPLVEKGYFLSVSKNGNQLQKKDPPFSKKSLRYLKKARKANKKENFSKALKFYKKAINVNTSNTLIINELADFFWENGDFDNVVFWAKKGIELNAIDFETHARLAMAYKNLGKNELAIEHIISSHLYNRNHPKIIFYLKSIFAENGMVYQDFVFQPIYSIESSDSNKISIQANDDPWKSYAACKALWQYDTTYSAQMSHFAKIPTSKIEDKECMLNALIGYERMKTGKENYPSLNIMGNALSNRMIDDYILYEVRLRKDPMMIYRMPEEQKRRLIRYLTTVRVNRKVNTQ